MLTENEKGLLTIGPQATLVDALRLIDLNQRGFVVVVDKVGKVKGTLTDGDIRRAILQDASIDESIEATGAFERSFTSLKVSQNIDDAIDIFKSGRIEFLPIVDDSGILVNILLKKQLYSLLLQCSNTSLRDDFSLVDENLVDFEVFNRPWGIYKTTVLQEAYQSKVLQVKPHGKLSLQYHNHREEYWTVASGIGQAQIGESFFELRPGVHVVIPRGCKHRLENTSDTEWLVVSEIQIGDYFGEDDIVRLEDDYGRVKGAEHV